MALKEEIKSDINSALKQGKSLKVLVLRQLSAALLNKEKEKIFRLAEKEAELTNQEIIEVIFFEAKKRRESIKEFEKGKRPDLVDKEKKELKILEEYLPEQLSEEEVRKLVCEAIEKTEAKEIKDIGKVMAELMPKTKGKADSGLVSRIVKEELIKHDSN